MVLWLAPIQSKPAYPRKVLRSTSRLFLLGHLRLKQTKQVSHPTLLSMANDWQLCIDDVTGKVSFPAVLNLDTHQRPDITIVSLSQRIIIWAELTVPIEERVVQSQIKKCQRYNSLAASIMQKNWAVHAFTIEVGSIGFVAPSLRYFLSRLGRPKSQLKWMINRASLITVRSSYYIWASRMFVDWDPPSLFSNVGHDAEDSMTSIPQNSI